MDCPNCSVPNQTGRFCEACGSPMEAECAACGAPLHPGARFCGACGQAVGSPAEPLQPMRLDRSGEHKHITVLFADLVGSLSLLAEDPEEAGSLLEDVLDDFRRTVQTCGGIVAQEAGDGIMALFGAPKASDDHALQACRAAIQMRRGIAALAAKHRRHLAIRVGIFTGTAIAGERSSGTGSYYTALGRTAHLAARLEKLAPPNGILISSATFSLAEKWAEATSVGAIDVRGAGRPMEAFLLTDLRDDSPKLDTEGSATPFVSRGHEIALLDQIAREAAEGHGRGVLITGEPGVGKSRLLRELATRLDEAGWRQVSIQGLSHRRPSPLNGIVDVVGAVLSCKGATETELRDRLSQNYAGLQEHVEPLLALAGMEPSGWNELLAEQRQIRVTRAVTALLLAESRVKPLFLALEDVQWIDPDSRELFSRLGSAIARNRILVIATGRVEEPALFDTWRDFIRFPLDCLQDHKIEHLIDALLGQHPSLVDLRRVLVERTGGNPLFIEESVRELVSAGTLAGRPGEYRLVSPARKLSVPARVQDVIAMRIDRLQLQDKRALQTAAVCGHAFDLSVLDAILPGNQNTLLRQLEHLTELQFLRSGLDEGQRFAFPHALIHEVAYNSLLRVDQKTIHRRIFEFLKETGPNDDQLDRIAFHATRAEVWDKAVDYLTRAGSSALARSACHQATERYEEALSLLPHLPENDARRRTEVDLRLLLRNALLPIGRHREIPAHLDAAARCQVELGDLRRMAQIDEHRCHAAWLLGRWPEAFEAGHRALASAEALNDTSLQVGIRFNLGLTAYSTGRFDEAIAHLTATSEITRLAERQRLGFFSLPSVVSRSWLAWCLAECGRFAEAHAYSLEALRISEGAGRPFDRIQALLATGGVQVMQGNWADAIQPLEKAFQLCREAAVAILVPRTAAALGYAYALASKVAEARDLQELALSEADRMTLPAMRPICLRWSAETAIIAGRTDEAADFTASLLAESEAAGEAGHLAWAYFLRGRIEVIRGELILAEKDLLAAMEQTRRLGMEPLLAECRRQLDVIIGGRGLKQRGRTPIAPAGQLYRSPELS